MKLSIAELAKKHSIKPLKKYGQNFIFDQSLCDKIAKHANINSKSIIVEIGPGPAGLTRSILNKNPKLLYAIETDKMFISLLEEVASFYPNKLIIIHDDALKISLSQLAAKIGDDTKLDIISNLPYNIGSKLIVNWMHEIRYVNSITVMLQKEVVERMTSGCNSKKYGRLSVLCQILCDVSKEFDVSANAFFPKPKVDSAIVKLIPKLHKSNDQIKDGQIEHNQIEDSQIQDNHRQRLLAQLSKITHHAFSSRRKMIKTSLKPITKDIESILEECELNPHARAENLSPQNYLTLAKRVLDINDSGIFSS